MPQCRYYDICGRDGGEGTEEDLCILHSEIPDKNEQAFATAFDTHRKERGDKFYCFVFPREIDFTNATFSEAADFTNATFSKGAHFSKVTFSEGANFGGATFSQGADFPNTTFSEGADFYHVTFSEGARFDSAKFSGRMLFAARRDDDGSTIKIFSGTRVDFRAVMLDPLDVLSLRDADLQQCLFL